MSPAVDSTAPAGAETAETPGVRRKLRELSLRVAELTEQRQALEADLDAAEAELSELAEGKEPRIRDPFDLDEEDWKRLRESRQVKFTLPCAAGNRDPARLAELLNIERDQARAVLESQERSMKRVWGAIAPLCAQVVGSAEVAELLGVQTCVHVVLDHARKSRSGEDVFAAITSIRSGGSSEPAPNEEVDPATRLLLATTSASRDFERDLSETFGAEGAKRIAYSQHLCNAHSTFGY